MFGKSRGQEDAASAKPDLRCSFCNKTDRDVRKLIAGPNVFICNECVDVCVGIIADDRRAEAGITEPTPPAPSGAAWPARIWCSLCRLPLVPEEALTVVDRGLVCRPCVSAVQATALAAADASRRHQDEQ